MRDTKVHEKNPRAVLRAVRFLRALVSFVVIAHLHDRQTKSRKSRPADPKPPPTSQSTTPYTPTDLNARNQEREDGYPGEYPFTRGVQATMYRGRLWTMRQYAGMADADETNRRYKYCWPSGTTGLSVAFDLPTRSARR